MGERNTGESSDSEALPIGDEFLDVSPDNRHPIELLSQDQISSQNAVPDNLNAPQSSENAFQTFLKNVGKANKPDRKDDLQHQRQPVQETVEEKTETQLKAETKAEVAAEIEVEAELEEQQQEQSVVNDIALESAEAVLNEDYAEFRRVSQYDDPYGDSEGILDIIETKATSTNKSFSRITTQRQEFTTQTFEQNPEDYRQLLSELDAIKQPSLKRTTNAAPEIAPPECAINNFRAATPCSSEWQQTADSARFQICKHCLVHVYNFTNLEEDRAKQIVFTREGKAKPIFYKRADGMFMTEDCPVGMKQQLRSKALIIGIVLFFCFTLCIALLLPGSRTEVTTDKPTPESQPVPSATEGRTTRGNNKAPDIQTDWTQYAPPPGQRSVQQPPQGSDPYSPSSTLTQPSFPITGNSPNPSILPLQTTSPSSTTPSVKSTDPPGAESQPTGSVPPQAPPTDEQPASDSADGQNADSMPTDQPPPSEPTYIKNY